MDPTHAGTQTVSSCVDGITTLHKRLTSEMDFVGESFHRSAAPHGPRKNATSVLFENVRTPFEMVHGGWDLSSLTPHANRIGLCGEIPPPLGGPPTPARGND